MKDIAFFGHDMTSLTGNDNEGVAFKDVLLII